MLVCPCAWTLFGTSGLCTSHVWMPVHTYGHDFASLLSGRSIPLVHARGSASPRTDAVVHTPARSVRTYGQISLSSVCFFHSSCKTTNSLVRRQLQQRTGKRFKSTFVPSSPSTKFFAKSSTTDSPFTTGTNLYTRL